MTFLIPEPIRDIASGLRAYTTFNPKVEASVTRAQEAVQQALLSAQRTALAAIAFFALMKAFPFCTPFREFMASSSILASTYILSFGSGGILTGAIGFDIGRNCLKAIHSFALKSLHDRLQAVAAIVSFGVGLWEFQQINTISELNDLGYLNCLETRMKNLASSWSQSLVKHKT
jgi:hypothetical protein